MSAETLVRLLALHRAELPQKDDLCGAFWGSLALRSAGIEPADQEAVALAADTAIWTASDPTALPPGEPGRRDYRAQLPFATESRLSGTTAAGVVRAVAALSDGALEAVPVQGTWTPASVTALLDAAAGLERPATLIANLVTGRLWGARPEPAQLVRYLVAGDLAGPPAEWDVGHFVGLLGTVRGARGTLVALADTYGSLGRDGLYLQPLERVADALERGDGRRGGILAVVAREDAGAIAAAAGAAGLTVGVWDNGTVDAGA